MTRTCAWCTAYMGEKAGEGVTHGVCRTCAEKMKAEAVRLANLAALNAVEDVIAMPRREQ